MGEIISSSASATKVATSMRQANNGLQDIATATFAKGTTVSGQKKAEESVTESVRLIDLFNAALGEDITNIERAAKAFQQADETLQATFKTQVMK